MARYKFEQIAINSTEKKKPVEEDRFTYVGLEHLEPGSLKVTRFGSETAPVGEKLVMHKGDVLFGKRRAYQKKVAIAPFDGIFSAHGMVLRPKEDIVDKNFFPLFISSDYFLDEAIRISVGSLSPTINWRDLKELEFELPDLEEQRKLAEVLWAINDAMEAYKKLISATEELVKSRFIEMFGDPIRNERQWPVYQLENVLEPGRTVTYGIVKTGDELDEGVPVFRPVDITNGHIPMRSELKCTTPEISNQYKRTLLNGTELLITVRGVIGETFQVTNEFAGCNVGRNIVPFRFDHSKVRNRFMDVLFHQEAIKDFLSSITKGIALQGINMGEFKKMPVIVPPFALQRRIEEISIQSDKSKFELEQTLFELTATYKRILSENLS